MTWEKKRPLSLAERIRTNQPVPLPVAALLSAATPVFRIGMWARLRAKRVRVDARVISFGNLTVGGTGKTPAVIERARMEMAAGHTVAVLTRGYGTQQTKTPVVVDGRNGLAGLYERVGDEPALIASKVPGVTGSEMRRSHRGGARGHRTARLRHADPRRRLSVRAVGAR